MNKGIISLIVLFTVFSFGLVQSQDYTSIPDPNFEQALIDLELDSALDGRVLTIDIDEVEQLDVSNREIADLSGIEGFKSLTGLNCSSNLLTSIAINNNAELGDLNCSSNQLIILNVTENPRLKTIVATSNQLASLDIGNNDSLTSLKCASNRLTILDVTKNIQLTELICDSNQLASLNIISNKSLNTLLCASNQLGELNVSENDSLVFLDCSDNQLASLNVEKNTILENLSCSANELTSLDVSQNDSLIILSCSRNQLKQLDVRENIFLENLICAANNLTVLDVSPNFTLRTLDCSFNLIETSDLSENDSLSFLDCSHNRLKSLNVRNDNNAQLGIFNALNNVPLTCISVDNETEIGDLWLKDSTATYSENCIPVQTYIPDNNFEMALINMGLDEGPLDSLVVTDSIRSMRDLDISNKGIADLTGIGDFIGLEVLNCSNNNIEAMDLIKNTVLTNLHCASNDLIRLIIKNNNNSILTEFDVSDNPALFCIAVDDETQIGVGWIKDPAASYSDNCTPGMTFIPDDNFEQSLIDLQLDTGPLDNYVNTVNIDTVKILNISSQNISDLTGIQNFRTLDSLDCSSNYLTALNLAQNTSLKKLICFSNYLTDLDVTSNDSLLILNCGNNQLGTLDVSQNTSLTDLIFDSNYVKEINTMANSMLEMLNINSNSISSIGLNTATNLSLKQLFASNNKLTDVNLDLNSQLVELDCSNNYLESLDLTSNGALHLLNCSVNYLTDLEVDSNTLLDTLNCNSNLLESLTLISNPFLKMLSCDDNRLTNVDVSKNDSLRTLLASSNMLQGVDLNQNSALNILNCNDNLLNELDITNNWELLTLSAANNHLDSLNTNQNIILANLICDYNQLKTLDVSSNIALASLSFANNQIESINISTNIALINLICDNNKLSSLETEQNILLTDVLCSGNEIINLDFSNQQNLVTVNCASNLLTSLNIKNANNDTLSTLNAVNNPDLRCIEVDNATLIGSNWQKDETASYNEHCHYNDTYIPDEYFESAVAQRLGLPDDNDQFIPTVSIDTLKFLDVSNENISDLTGIQDFVSLQTLNISNNNIDSIHLLENSDLLHLNAADNLLDTLDFSNNTLLEEIDISTNLLSRIDVGELLSLEHLACDFNQLASLNLGENTALSSLTCSDNQLVSVTLKNGNNSNLTVFNATENPDLQCIEIDNESSIGSSWLVDTIATFSVNCHYGETYVPDNIFEQTLIELGYDYSSTGPVDGYVPTDRISSISTLDVRNLAITDLTGIQDFIALENLDCRHNQLTKLDISSNQLLKYLDCSANQLTSLDVSQNHTLNNLFVSGNSLTSLEISQNPNLIKLNCSSNLITGLDIIQNINLTDIKAQFNQLVSVDANNGFNSDLSVFDLRSNPNLTCILVDDISSAEGYVGWQKDLEAQYKLECDDDDNDGIVDAKDLCPTTPFGDPVDLFGCSIFSLPIDNFLILTTGETCRNSNNGKISIFASETYEYSASLTGPEIDRVFKFTNDLEIRNLRSGSYNLCLTIDSQHDYKKCYSLVIDEPEDLEVFSVNGLTNGRIAYNLAGGTNYNVNFNGLIFNTENSYISLVLEKGRNYIRINTNNICQGTYEEEVFLSDHILIYPNPVDKYITVQMGKKLTEEVQINIYSTAGVRVLSDRLQVYNGKLEIDTTLLSSGVYALHLGTKTEQTTIKIVKK